MGGVWERQIRTIRDTLCGLFKLQTFDDEALMTLMCLVESILNSRPITKLSDDPRDPTPLTPNHLLLRSGPALPPWSVRTRFVLETLVTGPVYGGCFLETVAG